MLQNIKKRNEGFTIIEVLIVLAIAGLIMLIVFLAVPALQRNSRNNQRTSEVGRIGAAVADYVTNNNGKLPTDAAGRQAMSNSVRDSAGNLPQFGGIDKTWNAGATAMVTTGKTYQYLTSAPSVPAVIPKSNGNAYAIVENARCGDTLGSVVTGSNSREMALLYTVENGTNINFQILCKDI